MTSIQAPASDSSRNRLPTALTPPKYLPRHGLADHRGARCALAGLARRWLVPNRSGIRSVSKNPGPAGIMTAATARIADRPPRPRRRAAAPSPPSADRGSAPPTRTPGIAATLRRGARRTEFVARVSGIAGIALHRSRSSPRRHRKARCAASAGVTPHLQKDARARRAARPRSNLEHDQRVLDREPAGLADRVLPSSRRVGEQIDARGASRPAPGRRRRR